MQQGARAHLFINGRVQGVFYRAFTRDIALHLGLKGWVRNLPDGRVEIVFEGIRNDVEQAIKRCLAGPHGAVVSGIDTEWEPYQGNFKDFDIRYY